ncbi:NADP-dependent oxidoreductase [Ferrimicrobium acidiphilum]|uniref:NADP-dependent oxidoreductase n=1 Tax=Ferrimicrobium acidiphilum TaxID=121039 RepID=UPI0023F0541B|nr:NADP-dependent oxidoreductase [Ferrimicrobium acidiphilum]
MSQVFVLAKRPVGVPELEDFDLVSLQEDSLGDGELRIEPVTFSVDPYLRGRMSDARSYVAPFEVGAPIASAGIGKIIESRAEGFAVGDFVRGEFPWASSFVLGTAGLWKLPTDLEVDPSAYLGVLGMTGLTAYVGLVVLGKVTAEDEVLVTGAAGAVGSVVGQLARIFGARVVGSAGGSAKVEQLAKLGFTAGIDYRSSDFAQALDVSFPDGISLFFDNVGGKQFEAGLHRMKDFGRILSCGAISQYNDTELPPGPRGLEGLVVRRRLRIQGFIVSDHQSHYREYLSKATQWIRDGQLQSLETIADGFTELPTAFVSLFSGGNIGKMLVNATSSAP